MDVHPPKYRVQNVACSNQCVSGLLRYDGWAWNEWGAISNCWYLALGIAAVTCMPESKTCRLVVIELLILFQYPWEIQTCAADSTKTKRRTSKLVATRYLGFHHARKVLPKTPDAENIGFLITPFICQNLLHIKSYRILSDMSYQLTVTKFQILHLNFTLSSWSPAWGFSPVVYERDNDSGLSTPVRHSPAEPVAPRPLEITLSKSSDPTCRWEKSFVYVMLYRTCVYYTQ